MITPSYARTMAAYNAEMNRRIYAAAARLGDTARREQRGAFWGSIHATLNHLLWADETWMSRFADWPKPLALLRDSAALLDSFADMQRRRTDFDARILAWTESLTSESLAGDLVWFSQAAQREMRRPRALLVMHFFNHQTHHRGQAHAMLTAAGEQTGDTDLFVLV